MFVLVTILIVGLSFFSFSFYVLCCCTTLESESTISLYQQQISKLNWSIPANISNLDKTESRLHWTYHKLCHHKPPTSQPAHIGTWQKTINLKTPTPTQQEEQAGVEIRQRFMRASSHERERSNSDTRSVRL